MAQPTPSDPSLSGAERIRSLRDESQVFQAFDAYPWTKDKMFLSGLSAILGPPNAATPQGSPADMATHARIFYYAQRIGVQIDFSCYQEWLSRHPDHSPPQVLPDEYLSAKSSGDSDHVQAEPLLPWQQAAPKADLYVDKSAPVAGGAGAGASDQPNYPMGFAQMLQLLQEGKPIPGIREIPNTIVRDPSVKPVGSRSAPKKPWEKDSVHVASESSLPKALDTEFPPVDAEPAASSSAADPVAS